jgi:hypothetical protein
MAGENVMVINKEEEQSECAQEYIQHLCILQFVRWNHSFLFTESSIAESKS